MNNLFNSESSADFITADENSYKQLYEEKLGALKEKGATILEAGLPASEAFTAYAYKSGGKELLSNIGDYIGDKLGISSENIQSARDLFSNFKSGDIDINGLKSSLQSQIDSKIDSLQETFNSGDISNISNLTTFPSKFTNPMTDSDSLSLRGYLDGQSNKDLFPTDNEFDFETKFGVNNYENINDLSADTRFVSSSFVPKTTSIPNEPIQEGIEMKDASNFTGNKIEELNEPEDEASEQVKPLNEELPETNLEDVGETTAENVGKDVAENVGEAGAETALGVADLVPGLSLLTGIAGIGLSLGMGLKDLFDKPKEDFIAPFIPSFQA